MNVLSMCFYHAIFVNVNFMGALQKVISLLAALYPLFQFLRFFLYGIWEPLLPSTLSTKHTPYSYQQSSNVTSELKLRSSSLAGARYLLPSYIKIENFRTENFPKNNFRQKTFGRSFRNFGQKTVGQTRHRKTSMIPTYMLKLIVILS